MRAVVAGGAGFLGSHVADALSAAGHDVVIFDTRTSPYLRPDQDMVQGDILDQRQVDRVVEGASAVYNFAGIADIGEAKRRRVDVVRLNVLGNAILAESCHRYNVQRYLLASSVYVYGHAGSFYRSSKQAAELFVDSYQQICGLKYTILRYGSLYGPRSDARNGIFRILERALVDRRIEYPGDGDEVREFIHVLDAARLSVDALAGDYANEIVVLTGHYPMKIRDLLRMIQEILGGDVAVDFVEPKPAEHYSMTPYSFRPRVARKVTSNSYLDLGQGLLQLVTELHDSLAHEGGRRQ